MEEIVSRQLRHLKRCHVRFGSKADICAATSHVRFTPNSDRESGFPQTVMSALPPKADIGCLFDHLISDLLETKRSSIGLLWRKPMRAFS